jgi:hypothetical protein
MLACPYHSAWAALIGTDSIINENRGQSPRDYLNDLLAREDLKAARSEVHTPDHFVFFKQRQTYESSDSFTLLLWSQKHIQLIV